LSIRRRDKPGRLSRTRCVDTIIDLENALISVVLVWPGPDTISARGRRTVQPEAQRQRIHPRRIVLPRSVARVAEILTPGGRITRASSVAFLAAAAATLLALSVLGRLAGEINHLGALPRWHPRVSPQAFYYPTASEELARAVDGLLPDQTVVVVGGSSVMRGGMQGLDGMWSKQLQRELGDRFRVVNVAQPSGQMTDQGGVLTQALFRAGYRVVLVSDLLTQQVPQPDGGEYRYIYWDAFYKGLLPDNPRLAARAAANEARNSNYRNATPELKLRAVLDSQLRFADLWNMVGYTTVFTLWHPTSANPRDVLLPRRDIPDFDTIQLPPAPQRFQAIPPEEGRQLISAVAGTVCRQTGPETWVDDDHPEIWRERQADAEAAFPDAVKPHVILILTQLNPWFGQSLSADQRRCHEQSYEVAAGWVRSAGFEVDIFGSDWTDDDFADRLHLTVQGASKLASAVAPLVKAKATSLGYDLPSRP
jgi:hypothetical protein